MIIDRVKSAVLSIKSLSATRSGRIKRAVMSGFFGKTISIGVQLISIPIAVRYLGNEGYGLYVTLTSVLSWFQISNLGIGLGLQNALTEAVALNDEKQQQSLLSTAVFLLLGIVVVLSLGLLTIFNEVNWSLLFPAKSEQFDSQISLAVSFAIVFFLVTLLLSFVGPVYAALQRLDEYYMWNLAAQLIAFIVLIIAVQKETGLVGVVISLNGTVAVVMLVNAYWVLFTHKNGLLIPKIKMISKPAFEHIFRSGLAFFVIQLAIIGIYQADKIIIAHTIGTEQVTPYTIALKLFSTVSLLVSLTLAPFWPAYSEAKARGDWRWIKSNHQKILKFGVTFFTFFAFVAVIIGQSLLRWWVGEEATPSMLLLGLIGIYFVIKVWTDIHAILINGLDLIKEQAIFAVAQMIITVGGMLYLSKRLGILGIPVAGALGFIFTTAWFLPYLKNKKLKFLNGQ